MPGCASTTCPTRRNRPTSRTPCSGSAQPSAARSTTAACTPGSAPATSSCRCRAAATSRWSPRWTIRRRTRQPFGQAVRARAEDGGGWLGWVVAVDDLAPVEARLGRAGGPRQPAPAGRGRPALATGGRPGPHRGPAAAVLRAVAEPARRAPVLRGAPGAASWRGWRSAGTPRPSRAGSASRRTHPLDGIEVDWVDDAPGLQAVHFRTRERPGPGRLRAVRPRV